MVPIATHKDQAFDEESFLNFITVICRQHKIEGRALVFAFLVYDFNNHTITEILEKKNYWNSLNHISGKTLSIFYINSDDTNHKRHQKEIYESELRKQSQSASEGIFSYFVPVKLKPSPVDNAINFVKKEFELENNIKTPFVLFFQIDDEDQISDSFVVALKQERLEEAFLELRDHIKNAVESLNKVTPENYGNHQEIFNLVKSNVEGGLFYSFIRKKVISKLTIGTIISLIKLLAGSIK